MVGETKDVVNYLTIVFYIFMVGLPLTNARAETSLPLEALSVESELESILKQAGSQSVFVTKLQRWETLVANLKQNPDLLHTEIANVRAAMESDIRERHDQSLFNKNLATWNRLNQLSAKIGLTVQTEAVPLPTKVVETLKLDESGPQKTSPKTLIEKINDDPTFFESLPKLVATKVQSFHPDYALIYKGATGTEILQSASAYASKASFVRSQMLSFETDVVFRRARPGSLEQLRSDRSDVGLTIGLVSNSGMLRSTPEIEHVSNETERILKTVFKGANMDLSATSRAIGLRLKLVPVIWMAEALDVAQLTHSQYEADIRLAFEFSLRDLVRELIAVASFGSRSNLETLTDLNFVVIKKALRTPENIVYLDAALRQVAREILPSGYSEAKMRAPWSKKWFYFLDVSKTLKEMLFYRKQAQVLNHAAKAASCRASFGAPEIR